MTAAPVLRWPGSKWRIADWVIGHLPPHKVYVEPFFGSGGVFFLKEPAVIEIVNDLDGNVVNLFRVLREKPDELAHLLSLTPWAYEEYAAACDALLAPEHLTDVERARCLIVVSWQQYGKRAIQYRSGWRFRGVDQQSPMTAWRSLPDRVAFATSRLMNAQVSQMDGMKLCQRVNTPDTLLYVGLSSFGPLVGTLLAASGIDRVERRLCLALCAAAMAGAGLGFFVAGEPLWLTLAIVVAAMCLAIGQIVAAAIHG